MGELGLGGEVRRVPGVLPMCLALARRGVDASSSRARPSARPGSPAGSSALPADTVAEAAELVRSSRTRRAAPRPLPRATSGIDVGRGESGAARTVPDGVVDLADVRGQSTARRALEIALAGGHAMLLIGPPGAGKTLLARTIPGLLPDLDDEAALAATVVASVASGAPVSDLVRRPPVRAPHHTTSMPGWWAAGRGCRPER